MALKALMLRHNIDSLNKKLEALREEGTQMEAREKELEMAISEVTTDEERTAVEADIEKFDADKKDLEERTDAVEKEIKDLEEKLEEEEKEQVVEPEPQPVVEDNERKDNKAMDMRDMNSIVTREARMKSVVERDDVKSFLAEVRTCIKEKRALTNVGLTIPEVMLPLLEQTAVEASKLLSRVNMVSVSGKSRQVIMGTIPEAVWTEMCANLNELSLGFNDVEVDGYKVGGFFAVCNAVLEDNDVQLASKLVDALGKAIGKALDKAIIYGTGTKMPLGIVTRLAQTSEPSGYPATARTWVDLHVSNVITGTGKTGVNLFKEIVQNTKAIKNDYFSGNKIWVMNENTHNDLIVESMGINAQATIVAGMNNTMPVVGGEIVELPFIPDGNIICGYFDAYLLAQRAGTTLGQSEHARFLNDQTVFKGTARYDGLPTIAEAFEVFTITTDAPTTSGIPFPQDTANFS